VTVKEITAHIRQHGYDGSYDAVRRYLRRRAQGDLATWARAYQIVLKLPVPRAIDFLRLLTGGSVPVFTSARLRPFVREAACPPKPRQRKSQDLARQADLDWLRQVEQGKLRCAAIWHEVNNRADLYIARPYP